MTIIRYNNKFGQRHLTIRWIKTNGWRRIAQWGGNHPSAPIARSHLSGIRTRERACVARAWDMHLHTQSATRLGSPGSNSSRVDGSRVPARDPHRFSVRSVHPPIAKGVRSRGKIILFLPSRCFSFPSSFLYSFSRRRNDVTRTRVYRGIVWLDFWKFRYFQVVRGLEHNSCDCWPFKLIPPPLNTLRKGLSYGAAYARWWMATSAHPLEEQGAIIQACACVRLMHGSFG